MDSDARRGAQWHNTLHGQYWERVYRFLAREVGPTDAHDVAQQTFMIAWKKRDAVPDEPLGWLLNAARNDALKHRRWRLRHPVDFGSDVIDALLIPTGDTEGTASRRADLQRIWRQLSPDQQRILGLAYLDDLSGEQLGVALGVTAATARQRLSRATHRARELLGRGDQIPHGEHGIRPAHGRPGTTGPGDRNGC